MSIEAIAWAYTVDATPQERNVLFALALCANGDNLSRPGIPNLNRITHMEPRAIEHALSKMTKNGIVDLVEKGHRGYASTYRLRLSNMSAYKGKTVKNDTPLLDRVLINLINLSISGVTNLSAYPIKDEETVTLSIEEPIDEFTQTLNLVEEMTGYRIPNNQNEIDAINEMVRMRTGRPEIAAALAFLKGKKVARGACDLMGSLRYNYGKSKQAENSKPQQTVSLQAQLEAEGWNFNHD